jgi:hypothetical protein
MSKVQKQLARVRGILAKSRETLDYKIESARVDFTEEALGIRLPAHTYRGES